jgi:hypothetical protein
MMKIMNITINNMGKIELTYTVKSTANVGKMSENAKKRFTVNGSRITGNGLLALWQFKINQLPLPGND